MHNGIKLSIAGLMTLGLQAGCGKGGDQTPSSQTNQDIEHNLKQAGQNLNDAAQKAAQQAEPAVKRAAQNAQQAVHKAAQDLANRTATQPTQ